VLLEEEEEEEGEGEGDAGGGRHREGRARAQKGEKGITRPISPPGGAPISGRYRANQSRRES